MPAPHVAGDPGFVAWTNSVDTTLGGLSATYVPKAQAVTPEATMAELFRVQPFTAGSGPFRLLTNSVLNSDATYNHAAYLGWNPGTTHDNFVTTKPALAIGFEDNFTDAGGTPLHGMEFYLEYCSSTGAVQLFRPFYARIDSGSGTANNATIHMDIGTDGGLGSFGVYAGLLNPVIFTVTSAAVQATKPFSCTGGGIYISPPGMVGQAQLTISAGSQSYISFMSQGTGTNAWMWMNDTTDHFQVLDKNSRTHFAMTQGATPATALTEFFSALSVTGGATSLTTAVGAGNIAGPSASLNLVDSTAQALGTGGALVLSGKYSGASITEGAVIKAHKSTATSGQFGFDLAFAVRVDGGDMTERVRIPSVGGLVVGTAVLANAATNGFIYAPAVAGTPTGVPTARTGTVPIQVDTTAGKLWAYVGGAWKGVILA